MQIELELPWKVSTNKIYESKHWSFRKEIKDNYKAYCLPKFRKLDPVKEYPVKIKYEFEFSSHPLDTLNCAFLAKMIEDCLVEANVLIDDRIKYVQSSKLLSKKGKKDFVRLTICKISL